MRDFSDVDIVVMAGGRATRIAHKLPEGCPKFLAPFGRYTKVISSIGCEPFAGIFMEQLAARGARRAVLALAHLAEPIVEWAARYRGPIDIVCSIEREPRGTVSALRTAARYVGTDPILVINGDTLWDIDLTLPLNRFQTAELRRVYGTVDGKLVHAGADFIAYRLLSRVILEDGTADLNERLGAIESSWHYASGRGFRDIGR